MHRSSTVAASLWAAAGLAAALACAAPEPEGDGSDGSWVGTIETEGRITTVVNESGSVWGGAAELVEEASIGVDLGEDAYMLGDVGGLYATDDEIYVLDSQVPVENRSHLFCHHLVEAIAAQLDFAEFSGVAELVIDRSANRFERNDLVSSDVQAKAGGRSAGGVGAPPVDGEPQGLAPVLVVDDLQPGLPSCEVQPADLGRLCEGLLRGLLERPARSR